MTKSNISNPSWRIWFANSPQICGSKICIFATTLVTINEVKIFNKDTKIMKARCFLRSALMLEMQTLQLVRSSFSSNFTRKFSHHASDDKDIARNARKHGPKPLIHSVIILSVRVSTLLPFSVVILHKKWNCGMKITTTFVSCTKTARISIKKMAICLGRALHSLFLFFRSELLPLKVWYNFWRLGVIPVALNTRSRWIGPMFGSKWNTRRQSPTDWKTASATASTTHWNYKKSV